MPRSALDVLVLSDFQGWDANVVRDFLYSFNKHSKNRFHYLHNWARDDFRRIGQIDLNRFDAIVLFWDFFWVGANDPFSYCYIPDKVAERIARSSALKVQFLQDEYRDVRIANQAMNRFGVNVMFSCVAKADQELFYPRTLIPTLEATYPVLTGYVPTYLENVHHPASLDRPVDIGYRSRRLPYYLGTLGQEKATIADQFQRIAVEHRFSANISVREEDRIYGEDWLTFMRATRFSLGTESGASVVDFTGDIKRACQAYLREHPDARFEEVRARCFADVDGKVEVRTISPRIFEAAAFENTMVLHEGHYEGILQPDVHYIAVKPNYTNVDEVVTRMRDRAFCEQLARNAKRRLIDTREFNYVAFVGHFDNVLAEHRPAPSRNGDYSRTMFYVANYVSTDSLIPVSDGAIRVPHPVDLIRTRDRNAPYYMVLVYSAWLIINFLAASTRMRRTLLASMVAFLIRHPRALAGLFKDLRVLALLALARRNRVPKGPYDFATSLALDEITGTVTIESLPRTAEKKPDDDVGDLESLSRCLRERGHVSLLWRHEPVGDSLLLPLKNSKCAIYLNPEATWRFPCLDELAFETPDRHREILADVLFGKASERSKWANVLVVLELAWMMVRVFVIGKPLQYLTNWLRKTRPSEMNRTEQLR